MQSLDHFIEHLVSSKFSEILLKPSCNPAKTYNYKVEGFQFWPSETTGTRRCRSWRALNASAGMAACCFPLSDCTLPVPDPLQLPWLGPWAILSPHPLYSDRQAATRRAAPHSAARTPRQRHCGHPSSSSPPPLFACIVVPPAWQPHAPPFLSPPCGRGT